MNPTPIPTTVSAPEDWKNYTDSGARFAFQYPSETLRLDTDDEEKYSRQAKIEVREAFTRTLGYSPPQLISAVSTVERRMSQDGHLSVPFTIWVFDNQGRLSIDDWYGRYRYYPFVWGKALESTVENDRPKNRTKLGDVVLEFAIRDDMGTARYGYISSGKKMFLIVIRSDLGDQIFSTFAVKSE